MRDLEMTPFERRLSSRLSAYASIEVRPTSSREIARVAMAGAPTGLRAPGWSRSNLGFPGGRRTVWVVGAAVLLVAATLLALGGGGPRLAAPPSPGATATPGAEPTDTVVAPVRLPGIWISVAKPGETLVISSDPAGPFFLGTVRDRNGTVLTQDHMNANAGRLSVASTGIAGCSGGASAWYTIRTNPLGDGFSIAPDAANVDPCSDRSAEYAGGWALISSNLSASTALTVDPAFDLTGLWMSASQPGETWVVDPSLVGAALPLSTIRDPNGVILIQDSINATQGLMALESTGLGGGCPTTEFHTYAFRKTPSGGISILEQDRGNPDPCRARLLAYHQVWTPIWRP
jgi:hypothetical protein